MKIQVVDHRDKLLAEVVALGRKHSKTLGLFPEGAFRDHARKRNIYAATDGDQLLGYILFRITKSKQTISIAHLCINTDHRNKGIAKALLDQVKNKYSSIFKGISLSCRQDYAEASKFWEKYGFKAAQRVRSRSKDENYLIKWWYDFGNTDLFSSVHYSEDKVNALLDCNIVVKLRDEPCDDNAEALALAADWLEDEVDYFYAPEIFNEINRDENLVRAQETRKFLNLFKIARYSPNDSSIIYDELLDLVHGNSANDISDKKQLSECIASGLEYFITLDSNLLDLSDNIYEKYSVRVLRPSDFILFIDHSTKGRDYNSFRVAGAQFEYSNIMQDEIDNLVETTWLGKGEKKHELRARLVAVVSQIKTSVFKLVKDGSANCVGFFAATCANDCFTVKSIRVVKSKVADILFQQLIKDIILLAIDHNCNFVKIEENLLNKERLDLLASFGFEKKDGVWCKIILKGLNDTVNVIDSNPVIDNLWDRNLLKNRLRVLVDEPLEFFKLQLEKRLWPLKLSDVHIPVYIIPVRPHWASQLFDHYSANHSLFGAKPELTWSKENVYYRSVKPVSEKAPARILWYVSSESRVATGRGKGIVATSYLEEAYVGPAKTLYQKFKNYGIYEWRDVFELAGQNAFADIKALKFSDTEVFKKPVSLKQISKIFEAHGKPTNTFASPVEVPIEIFNDIYKSAIR